MPINIHPAFTQSSRANGPEPSASPPVEPAPAEPLPVSRLSSTGPGGEDVPFLHIVRWDDPVADPLGVPACSRYVELYWLGILGPSSTWLLRRLSYGLEVHPDGFMLHLRDTARSLGLGERMGKNSPFRRSLGRLSNFELARAHGPNGLAVRTSIPPLPLRHVTRLPASLQASHRRWLEEQRLPVAEQLQRRARRLAAGLVAEGRPAEEIEQQLARWRFHPSVAATVARDATLTLQPVPPRRAPGRASPPAGPLRSLPGFDGKMEP